MQPSEKNMEASYLPTLDLYMQDNLTHFCRILLAFAGQCGMAMLLGKNLDTLRLIVSQVKMIL